MSKQADLSSDAQSRMTEIFERLCVGVDVRRQLQQPKRIHRAATPVRMDDGSLEAFHAWRIQYDHSRGTQSSFCEE
ncbi:MAG: hypothetical protein KGY54_07950 [Oleiphilaceae bacterium]|nr:hypothetical protein [Oleiphilaceae bacterium]